MKYLNFKNNWLTTKCSTAETFKILSYNKISTGGKDTDFEPMGFELDPILITTKLFEFSVFHLAFWFTDKNMYHARFEILGFSWLFEYINEKAHPDFVEIED